MTAGLCRCLLRVPNSEPGPRWGPRPGADRLRAPVRAAGGSLKDVTFSSFCRLGAAFRSCWESFHPHQRANNNRSLQRCRSQVLGGTGRAPPSERRRVEDVGTLFLVAESEQTSLLWCWSKPGCHMASPSASIHRRFGRTRKMRRALV